jgi:Protein of unknown function (DUF2909)
MLRAAHPRFTRIQGMPSAIATGVTTWNPATPSTRGGAGERLVPLCLPRRLLVASTRLPVAERRREHDARNARQQRDDDPRGQHRTGWDNPASLETRSMRIIILFALTGILLSLGSALVYLVRDKGTTNRTVNALTVRVGISVALFLFILFSYWMGWIQPRSY